VKVPVKDVTLYAVCLENLHVRFETNARLIPFYGDQGEHADINPYWGELSCMYTLWNDCADPFFGIVNYRRNWEERTYPSSRMIPYTFHVTSPSPSPYKSSFPKGMAVVSMKQSRCPWS
jgi:hypothetical protein